MSKGRLSCSIVLVAIAVADAIVASPMAAAGAAAMASCSCTGNNSNSESHDGTGGMCIQRFDSFPKISCWLCISCCPKAGSSSSSDGDDGSGATDTDANHTDIDNCLSIQRHCWEVVAAAIGDRKVEQSDSRKANMNS